MWGGGECVPQTVWSQTFSEFEANATCSRRVVVVVVQRWLPSSPS